MIRKIGYGSGNHQEGLLKGEVTHWFKRLGLYPGWCKRSILKIPPSFFRIYPKIQPLILGIGPPLYLDELDDIFLNKITTVSMFTGIDFLESNMMRTGNPVLHGRTFIPAGVGVLSERMTINGTVNKTFIMLGLLVLTATWVWGTARAQEAIGPYMIGGAIGGLIIAMATIFRRDWAPITAPLYAAVEGLFIGGISAFFQAHYPGIVIQAVAHTFRT